MTVNATAKRSKNTISHFHRANPNESGNRSVRNSKLDTIRKSSYTRANQAATAPMTPPNASSSRQPCTSRPTSKSNSASWAEPASVNLRSASAKNAKETLRNLSSCELQSTNGAYYISKRVSKIPIKNKQLTQYASTVEKIQRKWPLSKIPRNIALSKLMPSTYEMPSTHFRFQSNPNKSSLTISNQTDEINVPEESKRPLNDSELKSDDVPSSGVINDAGFKGANSNEHLLAVDYRHDLNPTAMLVQDTCSQVNSNEYRVTVDINPELSLELPSRINESNLEITVQSLCAKIISEAIADFISYDKEVDENVVKLPYE